MTNQKTNPKIDWGFHIIIPRIVRTQYKKLTLVEKWLYVCLKDLCGDTGTCFRTLRTLAEETDLSTGTLSTGIRHLQEAGLIHAEKKRRSNNVTGKEVWHITIVDIWQENAKVHPTVKRSIPEQERSTDEHYRENVQDMNNNVQEVNEDVSKRSSDEQKRSNFDDRSNNNKAITITEERTIEERESTARESDTPTVSPPVVGALTLPSQSEIDEAMIREVIAQSSLSSEGEITEEFIQRTIDALKHAVIVHRARPGLSEHPDDQLPSKTEEFIEKLREWRREDEQQGDAHGYGDAHNNLNPDRRGPGGNYLVPGEHIQQTTRHQVLASGHQSVTSSEQDAIGEHRQPPAFHRESADGQLEQTTPTPTPAQASPPTSEQAALGPKGKGKKQAEVKPEFTPEGEILYQDWCSLFHVKIPRTKAIILAANDLYEPIAYWSEKLSIPRAEVLKRIMNWQYKNNPNYYGEGRGVKLFDVQRDIEGWISAAERKLARDALKVVPVREDKSGQFNMGPIVLESHRKGGLRGKALAPAH